MELEGYSRKEEDNPYKYTEEQKQEKKIALKLMKELYPDVNDYYANMVYDLCKNTSDEDMEKMKYKIENEKPRKPDISGASLGVFDSPTIIDSSNNFDI